MLTKQVSFVHKICDIALWIAFHGGLDFEAILMSVVGRSCLP